MQFCTGNVLLVAYLYKKLSSFTRYKILDGTAKPGEKSIYPVYCSVPALGQNTYDILIVTVYKPVYLENSYMAYQKKRCFEMWKEGAPGLKLEVARD